MATDSPAVNAATPGSNVPDFDQRGPGYSRVAGDGIDMGAFELQSGGGDAIFQDRFEEP
ncbi:MAG: choice-of-anchor Q domain-containing protein [Xanthomonadales bacterium]|nr:choice-of-anchor Q domain-containing protein [Xanthomonadales bacterium]